MTSQCPACDMWFTPERNRTKGGLCVECWEAYRTELRALEVLWGDGIPINVMAEFMDSGERREGESC
jgi:hypothetical protein